MPDHWLQDRLGEFKTSIVFCTRLPLFRTAPIGGTLLIVSWLVLAVAGAWPRRN